MMTRPHRGHLAPGILGMLLGALLISAPVAFTSDSASAANLPSADVVVVLKDDASASTDAQQHGVRPTDVYNTAVSGYAATVTPVQQAAIASDPAVQMVVPDVHFTSVGSHPRPFTGQRRGDAPSTTYPVEQYPQFVPTEVQRIGANKSRTAAIDGMNAPIDVGVAVLDTGIQLDNPELRVTGGINCSDEQTSDPSDFGDHYGHGTEVAGIVAAQDNAFGIVGVAPGARLYSVRVLDSTDGGELSNILCGVDWVTAHRNQVDIANMSLEGPGTDDHACGLRNKDALHYAICRAVLRGVTVVAGAGNDASDAKNVIPASYNEVIAVSGLADSDGQPGGKGTDCGQGFGDDVFAPFSNSGRDIDIAAVATCAVSDYDDGSLVIDEGTSFATPAVSGAAALLLQRHPHLPPLAVELAIRAARERAHLSGDPDGIDEGVLDVRKF